MKKLSIAVVTCLAVLTLTVNAGAFVGTFYDSTGYVYTFSIGTNGG